MDRSGAMPRRAWVEIRDEHGELIQSFAAQISGGGVSAELPAFEPGTKGTVELCLDESGTIDRMQFSSGGLLPTSPEIILAQVG